MSDATLPPSAAPQAQAAEPSLHRVMGPWLLLLFIVGDILGTGIYALTGQVAKQVGGMVWLPFVVAFVVALMTAFSYLELVTKYPRAAGAAQEGGALETGEGLGLPLEHADPVRVDARAASDHLEGDGAPRMLLLRLVDDLHPAAAELSDDSVVTDHADRA